MKIKYVSLEMAKRLKEAGWVKKTELYWCQYSKYNTWKLESFFRPRELRKSEYYAPDLLDITREIQELCDENPFNANFDGRINAILWEDNEVDYAAEIWVEMKKEGL